MRFEEIWGEMVKNGKKARRKGWDVYWQYNKSNDTIETYYWGMCVSKKVNNDDLIKCMDNILADDWELLSEPRTITVNVPSIYVSVFDQELIDILKNAKFENYGETVTLRNCDILYIKGLIYLLENYKDAPLKEEEE